MQVNTVTIESDEYRDLIRENTLLCERMSRLYEYIESEEIEAAKRGRSLILDGERVLEVVCYHRSLDTNKRIRKIIDQKKIEEAEEVSRNVDLV